MGRISTASVRTCFMGLVLGLAGCGQSPPPPGAGAVDPALALSRTPAPGYTRVSGPRPFVFPADYGPHPETQTEWWYATGNLETADGRPFGYQFTIFRLGVVPPALVTDSSAWAVGDLYMAHLAVSDLSGSRFVADQRLTRPALGLAGAQANPFRVWLEDWSLESLDPASMFPLELTAQTDGLESGGVAGAIELELDSGKPVVLQGDRGYSRKGADAGNASHYYSFTRMPTRGTVTVGGERFAVQGDSWLDREWSTSVLSRSQRGWDWFALQLSDGRDLMLFELRSDDPALAVRDGTLVAPDGSSVRLQPADVELEVLTEWASGVDGVRYPSAWRLTIPRHGIDLTIRSAMDDQEHNGIFRYWEGAVRITDAAGAPAGRGYAELTGYTAQQR